MSPPRLSLVLLLLPPCASAVRFLVLRHGQTDHNRDGIIQGSSDVSRLSDRGRTQAREVGAALARLGDVRVARTFLSPLARAQQTHEILLLDRPDLPTPTTLDGLREIDLGSWEGRAKAELRAEQPDVYAAWQCDPLAMVVDGRKPIVELWERARSAAWLAMLDADSRPASPHISPYLEALDAAHRTCVLRLALERTTIPPHPAVLSCIQPYSTGLRSGPAVNGCIRGACSLSELPIHCLRPSPDFASRRPRLPEILWCNL